MTTLRQDAWTNDEDLLLVEVVLRHIREGSTQLAAFEEVGKKLSRTSAACGFRWNSAVRKQYKSAIAIAKKQRKGENIDDAIGQEDVIISNRKKKNNSRSPENGAKEVVQEDAVSFHSIKIFLSSVESTLEGVATLKIENQALQKELLLIKKERIDLLSQIDELTKNYTLIEEDYKALIEIMERARRMIVLGDDEGSKHKFQMDKNGNLERVNK